MVSYWKITKFRLPMTRLDTTDESLKCRHSKNHTEIDKISQNFRLIDLRVTEKPKKQVWYLNIGNCQI